MARKHRWGRDYQSDAVEVGKLAARGISKLGSLVKGRAAARHVPEHLQRLVAAIQEFQPTKKYQRERDFQVELTGFLQARFGKVELEVTRGRSRPDIVVSKVIAIEIKGPTTNHELQTIADKVVRYRQHFESFVAVLFDVQDLVHFAEWKAGIERQFPGAVIIRK